MKKYLCIILILCVISGFVFGNATAEEPADKASEFNKAQEWAVANGLSIDERPDELYKKALEEGGKVVIYTASSRHAKVKADFEATYPGMELIAYNISTGDLVEKLRTEYEAGLRNVDIVQSKEVNGEYTKEFFEKGILVNYQPETIFGNVDQIGRASCRERV